MEPSDVGTRSHPDLPAPLAREFRSDLSTYDAPASPGFVSFEGYIAARVFVEGLREAGRALVSLPVEQAREMIVDAIERLSTVAVPDIDVSFSATDHEGGHSVWPTIIGPDGFELVDWERVRRRVWAIPDSDPPYSAPSSLRSSSRASGRSSRPGTSAKSAAQRLR